MLMYQKSMAARLKVKPAWMAKVEKLVVAARPNLAGRMDWTTAEYLWRMGDSPEAASTTLIRNDQQK